MRPGQVGGQAQLAEQTARRLEAAGILGDDPGLVYIREHNREARQRGTHDCRCGHCPARGHKRHPGKRSDCSICRRP